MKVRLQIEEDLGRKVIGLELGTSKYFFCGNTVKNLPILLWFVYMISVNVRDALVDCTFAFNVIDELNKWMTHQGGGKLLKNFSAAVAVCLPFHLYI